jgi:hypothetical protein
VGFAGQARIHGLQCASRAQQHRRSIDSLAKCKADRPAESLRLRSLTLVERGERCSIQQRARPSERAVGDCGLRGGEHPPISLVGVRREPGGPLEQCRGRRVVAAPLRPIGSALQLGRDVLVRRKGCGSQMPRSTIAIDGVIERLHQRPVDPLTLGHGGLLVDRQAKQRMSEGHPLPET